MIIIPGLVVMVVLRFQRYDPMREKISYTGCIFWNRLPNPIKAMDSLTEFKASIKIASF